MPTAVVSAPHTHLPSGPMARSSQDISPRSSYQNLAPGANEREQRKNSTPVLLGEQPTQQAQQQDVSPSSKRPSPNVLRPGPPKIVVKKEPPSSPDNVAPKHRPRKLDLSNSTGRLAGPATAAPTLGMQDVGIACLSPGFQTQNPAMREQLARSMSVRDSQRALIESRLQKNSHGLGSKGAERVLGDEHNDIPGSGSIKAPSTGKKRGPPPGLSIVAPSAHQFANERVIQSAPLNQTFTGRDAPPPHPMQPRQVNGALTLGNSSHIHGMPPNQVGNRLPPIDHVIGGMSHPRSSPPPPTGQPGAPPQRPGLYQSHSSSNLSTQRPGAVGQYPPSPGFPPPGSSSSTQQLAPATQPPPITSRPREYRSAEEAVAEMTQGREDLQPRIVHYGGHQPPTPPSPQPGQQGPTPTKHPAYGQNAPPGYSQQVPQTATYAPISAAYPGQPQPLNGSSRRRTRAEYERDNGSPPLGSGPSPRAHRGTDHNHQAAQSYGTFASGRDSPTTQKARKDEFMACIARAWDLWHSLPVLFANALSVKSNRTLEQALRRVDLMSEMALPRVSIFLRLLARLLKLLEASTEKDVFTFQSSLSSSALR